ncbi:MAG: SRPBCC family protein [Spirochaetia bacterium]
MSEEDQGQQNKPLFGSRARAVADLAEGHILATVEVPAPPERVFLALTSGEITEWWVRAGVFDTREWTGDVREGGVWRATGVGNGKPYALEGEFLEVNPPRKLVHSWRAAGAPGGEPTVVTYLLERLEGGTRVTLRHTGFASREACLNTCIGWETSFQKLAEILL